MARHFEHLQDRTQAAASRRAGTSCAQKGELTMLDRGDAERSDPRAPWNQPDAIMCPKHPDIEMIEVEDEDEDGKYFFSYCKVCEAIE